jgi:hypothetical protein
MGIRLNFSLLHVAVLSGHEISVKSGQVLIQAEGWDRNRLW